MQGLSIFEKEEEPDRIPGAEERCVPAIDQGSGSAKFNGARIGTVRALFVFQEQIK
jgi:hypothetical protein